MSNTKSIKETLFASFETTKDAAKAGVAMAGATEVGECMIEALCEVLPAGVARMVKDPPFQMIRDAEPIVLGYLVNVATKVWPGKLPGEKYVVQGAYLASQAAAAKVAQPLFKYAHQVAASFLSKVKERGLSAIVGLTEKSSSAPAAE